MDTLRFASLGSGSSGNSYYIGNQSFGILIDAGVGVRKIRKSLRSIGLDFHNIWGVFVTHDHADHIKAVGSLGEIHHIPIYATKKTHEGINRNYIVTQKLVSSVRHIEVGETTQVGEFLIKSFPVSHDASEAVGYSISYKGKVFTIATDLGYINDMAEEALINSDMIIIEANHDEKMLWNSSYPYYLKERIVADTGHLSNRQAAEFIKKNYTKRWKYIFLCHLSKDNNRPELALLEIENSLAEEGIKHQENTRIVPLERLKMSEVFAI